MGKVEIGQMVRQGDVLLKRVAELPENARLIQREGAIIVEYGEATGHTHTIERGAELYSILNEARQVADQYLLVLEETELRHQEHGTIQLEPGVYERWYQVEDDGSSERRVTD